VTQIDSLRATFRQTMAEIKSIQARYPDWPNGVAQSDADEYRAKLDAADDLREQIALAEREEGLDNWAQSLPQREVPTAPLEPEERNPFRLYGSVTAFGGPNAEERAYKFGRWVQATVLGDARAEQYCRRNGIQTRAAAEGTNSAGGYLVPEQFLNDLVALREQYGTVRQNAHVIPMTSNTLSWPKRGTAPTVYYPGEGGQITESSPTVDVINLAAKKLATLTYLSSELAEDAAAIAVGNWVAEEIAWRFAYAEDLNFVSGDGTATYGTFVGVKAAMTALNGTLTQAAGYVAATGNLWSEFTLSDFAKCVGTLPVYAETPRTAWYVSKAFWGGCMLPLALGQGGVSAMDAANGIPRSFLGYPVRFLQTLPKANADSTLMAIFGDLYQAVALGDRREVTIATSEHYRFAYDQIAIRGTERIDIGFKDLGNASATASARVPGSIVGLYSIT